LSEETRVEMGIVKKLPRTLIDAWKFLLEDKEMVKELGEEFVKSYISVKEVRSSWMKFADDRPNSIWLARGTKVNRENG
jgi:glutamine synthetase